jgi:hypothetical protein
LTNSLDRFQTALKKGVALIERHVTGSSMLLREEQTFLSLFLRPAASGSFCKIARKPDEKRRSVKDSDSDEEAADVPIRPIP